MMWKVRNCAMCEGQEKPESKQGNSESLDFYIYSDVDKKFWDDDDCTSAEDFRKVLEANPDAKNINLYINSYGGSVSEGVAIYSQLKRHNAYVTAYIDGFACSIASVIPMAADKVVMSDCAMMMIHNPWTFAVGNSADMRKCADDLDKILEGSIIPAYKSKINGKISDEKLRELLNNSEFLTSAECLEYGLVDEVANSSVNKEEAQNKFNSFVNEAKARFMNSMRAEETPAAPVPEKGPEEPVHPEPEKEPEEPDTPAPEPEENPVEDNSKYEYFMKLLKGEI